jgi:hypothetical protein
MAARRLAKVSRIAPNVDASFADATAAPMGWPICRQTAPTRPARVAAVAADRARARFSAYRLEGSFDGTESVRVYAQRL